MISRPPAEFSMVLTAAFFDVASQREAATFAHSLVPPGLPRLLTLSIGVAAYPGRSDRRGARARSGPGLVPREGRRAKQNHSVQRGAGARGQLKSLVRS
jgi:hypothetical protein